MKREIRTFGEIVRRAEPAAGGLRPIGGYAAVFNSDTSIGEYFIERIAPGAFSKAIARDDVRCLFNHHDRYVIGRTSSGTLRLSEDAHGLAYEADPPDATWARDMLASIERGDITQSSFAFRATVEKWDETGPMPIRTVMEVELLDVSPVTYPAYDDTEVGVRARDVLVDARAAGLIAAPPAARLTPSFRLRADLDLRLRTPSRL